jgi:hypothetical protein
MAAGPRITCGDCGDIIRSTYRHDWVACKCFVNGNAAVADSLGLNVADLNQALAGAIEKRRSRALPMSSTAGVFKGCYIDGGSEYTRIGGNNWSFTALACPFCGETSALEIINNAVVCSGCGAQGPITTIGTEQSVFDSWNNRNVNK